MKVTVRGIKNYKDRHNKPRRYHRASGTPIPLHLEGAALAAEVHRLNLLHQKQKVESTPGSLRLLVDDYKANSEHWESLRDRTRKDYERVLKWLGDGGLDTPLVDITAPEIAELRNKARTAHEYKFANQVLTTLKMVLQHGFENGFVSENAAAGIKRSQRPKARFDAEVDEEEYAANRPWTKAERSYVLQYAPIHLRVPVALGLYTGARQGDILRMSKRAYMDGWIRFTASKNRKRIEVPVSDDLAALLAAIPINEATTLVVNSRLKPWSSDGFRTSWGKWRDKAEKDGHIGPDLTFHGTRHTIATALSEDGWDDKSIGLQLGQDSDAMPKHYSRRAKHEERKLLLKNSVQKANKIV
jgi:integrase